jgi:hypothetical protein
MKNKLGLNGLLQFSIECLIHMWQLFYVQKQWIFISPDPLEAEFSWDYIETKIIDDGVNVGFIMNSSIPSTYYSRGDTSVCVTHFFRNLFSYLINVFIY